MPGFRDKVPPPQPHTSRNGAGPAAAPAQERHPHPSKTRGSSFAARFGRVILGHGIAALPTALLHFQGRLDLSAQHVWFVCNILAHKWDEDLPYPSLNKMARLGGVDKTQLYDYKDRLCEMGYLRVLPRHDPTGKRDTNAYDFAPLFARLEAFVKSEPPPNAIRGEGDAPEQFEAEMRDTSFVARYGRVISSYGVTAVPRALFTHGAALGLTLQQVWFATYIFSYRWDTPLPYPSIKKMSAVTGYSAVQLHKIKGELVRKGYLRLVARRTEHGGQDSNAYDFSGLLDAITRLLRESEQPAQEIEEEHAEEQAPEVRRAPRRGRRGAQSTRPTLEKGDEKENGAGGAELSPYGGGELAGYGGEQFTGYGGGQLSYLGGGELAADGGAELPSLFKGTPPAQVARGLQGTVVKGSHKVETVKKKEAKHEEDDSNQHSRVGEKPKTGAYNGERVETKMPLIPGFSPYIAAVVTDYSEELGDAANVTSNVTQALRLWQRTGLGEQEFVEALHEARRQVRTYQGRQGAGGIGNKMAYFFAVLREGRK